MECRYKEKIAGSNQSLKVEGKTHRFLVVPLVPSSVCRGCSHMFGALMRLATVTTARNEKWTKSQHQKGCLVLSQHWVLSGA